MRKRQSKDFWKKHILNWKQSGQNQSQYCRSNNLNKNSFSKWKTELEGTAYSFVEIPSSDIFSKPELELIIGNEFKIKLSSGFDPNLLKKIISVFEEYL